MSTDSLYPNLAGKPNPQSDGTVRKLSVKDRVIRVLEKDPDLPAFSGTLQKLMKMIHEPDVHLDSVTTVVKLDPGITSRVLKLASSPTFGGQEITSIEAALAMIGMREFKKIVATIGLINTFANLRVQVNWDLFWLHSIFTARLTEVLTDAYRETTGREYLAGLLHDVGKLVMEHYFPKDFETVVFHTLANNCTMHESEKELFDITHAEVSALLCKKWQLHQEIIDAIRAHHDPVPATTDEVDPYLLTINVRLANKLSNMCNANILREESLENIEMASLPDWARLKQNKPRQTLILDLAAELKKAQEIIETLKGSNKSSTPKK